MYTTLYIHKINKKFLNEYLVILKEAKEIYLNYGVTEVSVFEPIDLSPKYGCSGLEKVINPDDNEILYVELNQFKNKEHHDKTMTELDNIPRINELYNELMKFTSMENIIRGEFAHLF
ncbi:MAG: DUF1428 family protein [Candidatus Hodarchaeales archaeon]